MNIKRSICAVLAAAAVLGAASCKKDDENTSEAQPSPEQAASETVYSGVLEAASSAGVYADATGQILTCTADEGSYVSAGQVLYTLDGNGIEDDIATASRSLEKAKITLSTAQKNVDDLKVYAPASGILKDFTLKTGERVNTQTIGIIADESRYVARVPFTSDQLASISTGAAATVICDDMMSSMNGRVTRIYAERNTSVMGADLYDVEITGANSGGLPEGMAVSAEINGEQSPLPGYIDEASSAALVSRGSGNAKAVYYKEGDYVKAGALVVDVENDNTTASLRRAELDAADAQTRLDSLNADKAKLTIKAPISGVVTEKKKSERDTVSSKSDSIMTISDISSLTAEISVADDDAFGGLYEGMTLSADCGGYGTASATVESIDTETKTVTVRIVNTNNMPAGTIAAVSAVGGVWNV